MLLHGSVLAKSRARDEYANGFLGGTNMSSKINRGLSAIYVVATFFLLGISSANAQPVSVTPSSPLHIDSSQITEITAHIQGDDSGEFVLLVTEGTIIVEHYLKGSTPILLTSFIGHSVSGGNFCGLHSAPYWPSIEPQVACKRFEFDWEKRKIRVHEKYSTGPNGSYDLQIDSHETY